MQEQILKKVQNLAGIIGLGVINVDDPDYQELCELHRRTSDAFRRGDYTSAVTSLDRDFQLVRQDQIALSRREYEEQLRHRLESQVQTDYREEPAHMVIRRNRAKVATRIYGKTICRRDGKLIELEERGEHLSEWAKSESGWKRVRTKIRSYEQNIEWLREPTHEEALPVRQRSEKFLR